MAYQSPCLDDLELFVAVVDAGGFTAASRAIGARKALLSRRVQELEERLGVRLLERTTRTIRLTEAGAAFHAQATQAVSRARDAILDVAASQREPTGTLRISATQLLAEIALEPVIVSYLDRYRSVSVDLDVSSRTVDLIGERFDVALRVGPSKESSLTGRLLGKDRTLYLASPKYIAAHGLPKAPADVAEHDAVVIAGAPLEWPFERRGRKHLVKPRVRLATASYSLARRAAVGDLGLVRLPRFYVANALRTRALRAVLEEWTPSEVQIFAMFAGVAHLPVKTRAFLDLLTTYLRAHPIASLAGSE